MLLRETGWDVIQARDLYLEHQFAFDEFTNSYSHFRGPTQLRSERDDRLSRQIDLTARRDIDSLQAHMRLHDFNFIAAVVTWQKSGIPSVNVAERPQVEAQLPTPEDILWESESPSDTEEAREEDNEAQQDKDVVRRVAVISPDRGGAVIKVHDYTKMFIEYIRNGKYEARIFRNKNFRWSTADTKDLPDFDWNKQKDIYKLNNWRREILSRVTGIVTPPAQCTVGRG